MKKFGFLLLVSALVLTITACGKEEAKKLVMATSADYYPYEFIDTDSGSEKILGFDIDVANLIAEELGIEYEIKNMDFNGLLATLQTGQADFVMASMTPNEERAKSVDFSKVYYGGENSNSIVSLKSSNIKSLEELNGKNVAAQLGTAQEQTAKTIAGIEYTALNKIPEMVQEVLAGRVDAIIIEKSVAVNYVETYTDLEYTPFIDESLNGIAIAFPKESDKIEQFNKAIDKLIESGKIDELVEKWLKEEQ